MSKPTIFILPFAGGSSYSFRPFLEAAANENFTLFPVELPGRGTRIREHLVSSMDELIQDIFVQIRAKLHAPYAIFGHSMGALLGYVLTQRIKQEGLPLPLFLLFTGSQGPSVPEKEPPRYLLSKQRFIEKLKELGGCPDELLNNIELLDFFEPIIRSDFQTIETYNHTDTFLLDISITVAIGSEEKITHEEALAWQNETLGQVEVVMFEGKHFFLFNHIEKILEIISKNLGKAAERMRYNI